MVRTQWQSRSVRERQMIGVGALIIAGLLLYAAVYLPWRDSITELRAAVRSEHAQVVWLRGAVLEVENLRKTRPSTPPSPGSARLTGSRPSVPTLLDRSAREGGLGEALRQVEPQESGLFSVRFESVEFDALLHWLADLGRRHGIEIVNAVIDLARNEPAVGLVDARLILRAAAT